MSETTQIYLPFGNGSDTKAGRTDEDATLLELEIPVTTDEIAISEALQKIDENNMRVVFCTYHSLPIVEEAQNAGAPAFDIICCDEGHRTTGLWRRATPIGSTGR